MLRFASLSLVLAAGLTARAGPAKRAGNEVFGFFPPADNGGSMLEVVPGSDPANTGEPLNVIISGLSDSAVLVPSHANGGLLNYFASLNFSESCDGLNIGNVESANLGDGQGLVGGWDVMRYNFGDPVHGTCNETAFGGNHFRWFPQNGSQAQSNAVFLAVSYEMNLTESHNIVPDGYNLGRDLLVANATQTTIPNPNPLYTVMPTSSGVAQVPNAQYIGHTSANGYTYQTTATYLWGLLSNTSIGVNHNATVPLDGRPALDGLVALLVVNITGTPKPGSNSSSSGKTSGSSAVLPPLPLMFATSTAAAFALVGAALFA